jgi:calcium-dependent protein kinase
VLKQIGPYTYDEKTCLGEGAYGKVYKGTDTRTNEKVAIKRLDLAIFEKDRYLRGQIGTNRLG